MFGPGDEEYDYEESFRDHDEYYEDDSDCDEEEEQDFSSEEEEDLSDFADPGGESALRAATSDNPRNLPCPTCKRPDLLTPKDRQLGYQCDGCARQDEIGY